jgi:hypothetical protein
MKIKSAGILRLLSICRNFLTGTPEIYSFEHTTRPRQLSEVAQTGPAPYEVTA